MVMVKRLPIVPLVETPELRVLAHEGTGDVLTVSFSGVGQSQTEPQGVEFARIATDEGKAPALFIIDPHRTWLNGPGLIQQIVQVIEEHVAKWGIRRVVTVGHSMGGYAAALIAAHTKVDVAFCLSPQASVHPEVVGDDPRWMAMRIRIENHLVRGLAGHMAADTQYIVIYGDRPREFPQFSRFPEGENVHVLMMPDTGHGVSLVLKRSNMLGHVAREAFAGRPDAALEVMAEKFAAYRRRPDQIRDDCVVISPEMVRATLERADILEMDND